LSQAEKQADSKATWELETVRSETGAILQAEKQEDSKATWEIETVR